ncbi:Casein kinase II subunit alpha [Thelohanellus kitauei]|uniref:non-specific serine/threonine protein kinase n=1 Tax=Thelohanellus kitauei TaxID=669202 RepID=A0A0C2M2Y2_THEKT|nr:Casein kinase II subunit alpha [Thelohanellus kitauei]
MSTSTVQCISRVFAYVNKERPDSYSNYDSFDADWSSPDSYQLVRRIGRGKYSDVFTGVDVRIDQDIVVKVLKVICISSQPVRKRKIGREIKILQNLRGHPNIVSLLDITRSERGIPSLIFEYIECLEYSVCSA